MRNEGVGLFRGLGSPGEHEIYRSSTIAVIVRHELSGKNEHAGQYYQANDPQSRVQIWSQYLQQTQKNNSETGEIFR